MITLWTVGSIIEKCRDSLAKSAGEEVSSHIGYWIFTDRLRLEQRGELGKKWLEQLPSAVIWPALIDCSLELLDKAPRGSNSTLIWYRGWTGTWRTRLCDLQQLLLSRDFGQRLWRWRSFGVPVQGDTERERGREGVLRVQEVHTKLYEVLTVTMEELIDAETMASLGGNWTAALGFLAARLVVLGLGGG